MRISLGAADPQGDERVDSLRYCHLQESTTDSYGVLKSLFESSYLIAFA